MNPVTLQISLEPGEHRPATQVRTHPLRTLGSQVAEVLLVINLHRSANCPAEDWNEGASPSLP